MPNGPAHDKNRLSQASVTIDPEQIDFQINRYRDLMLRFKQTFADFPVVVGEFTKAHLQIANPECLSFLIDFKMPFAAGYREPDYAIILAASLIRSAWEIQIVNPDRKLSIIELGCGPSVTTEYDYNSPVLSRYLAYTFPELFDVTISDIKTPQVDISYSWRMDDFKIPFIDMNLEERFGLKYKKIDVLASDPQEFKYDAAYMFHIPPRFYRDKKELIHATVERLVKPEHSIFIIPDRHGDVYNMPTIEHYRSTDLLVLHISNLAKERVRL